MTALAHKPATATVAAERQLIRLMFEDHSIIPYVQAQLSDSEIQGAERKTIINSIFAAYNMGKSPAADMLAVSLAEEAANELSNIMVMESQCSDVARMVDDCLKAIRLAYLKSLYEQHRLRAHELERMGDSNFLQELAESQRIKDEISKLHQS